MAAFHQWQFIKTYTADRPRWFWQRITIDGSIAFRSPEFNDYADAVIHAIQHGRFRPKSEPWSIITEHGARYYEPTEAQPTPTTVPAPQKERKRVT